MFKFKALLKKQWEIITYAKIKIDIQLIIKKVSELVWLPLVSTTVTIEK
jgi:hypothetical protein